MKILKTFEAWNDNIIDKSLFSSGKAKYHPKVIGGVIKYKTGNAEPYFFAEIVKKGDKFICKIYKKKKNGKEIRIRNKIKKSLKTAHNYVREFLNQKLKRLKKKKDVEEPQISRREKSMIEQPQVQMPPVEYTPPKSKTIIRRF